jgi:hypothetical protein
MTNWTNPTDYGQYVDISVPAKIVKSAIGPDGQPRSWTIDHETKRITWAPGETKAIPSIYDRSLHQVWQCGHAECRNTHCKDPANAGPNAILGGGMAPLLVREGQRYPIEPCLVTKPSAPRHVVAPEDIKSKLAETPDPTMDRARARRAGK